MIVRSTALALPLRDACVDLIVTSPPYWALRSYRDGDEHYDGQLGSEETPGAFVDALIEATREMIRVLKPTGSIFVNLGDKYAGSGGHNNNGTGKSTLVGTPSIRDRAAARIPAATRRNAPDRYNQNSGGIPAKSLMGLPWRYANACVDRLGLILRAEIIWSKPNGLPESVTDRVRRAHEQWFHFVKQGRYYSAVDEVREGVGRPTNGAGDRLGGIDWNDAEAAASLGGERFASKEYRPNPLGKLPGSVWTIPSEPLIIPPAVQQHYDLPDHFAAFPQEWPRRLILGWSPSGVCTECGEGRRPVVEKEKVGVTIRGEATTQLRGGGQGGGYALAGAETWQTTEATITGYACACTPCNRCADLVGGANGKDLPRVWAANHQGSPSGEMGDRTSLQAEPSAVLQSDLFQPLERPQANQHQVPPTDDPRLCGGVETESSDGAEERLRDGTPPDHGGASGTSTGAIGGGAPPQRGEDGQQDREPRVADAGDPRSVAETATQAVQMPPLRRGAPKLRVAQSCPYCDPAPTRPSVILDPFGGTGTVAMTARALGRHGLSFDLSSDYCRLARWRIHHSGHAAKTEDRTWADMQGALF